MRAGARVFALLVGLVAANTSHAADVAARDGPVIAMAEDRVEFLLLTKPDTKYAYEGRLRVAFVRGDEGWRAACKFDMSLGHQEDCKSEDANPFKQLYVHDGKISPCDHYIWASDGKLLPEQRLAGCAPAFRYRSTCDRLVKWGGSLYEPAFKPEPVTTRSCRSTTLSDGRRPNKPFAFQRLRGTK